MLRRTTKPTTRPTTRLTTQRRTFRGTGLLAVLALVLGGIALGTPHLTPHSARSASYNPHSPIGHLDAYRMVAGTVWFAGWDFDPDSPHAALTTYVTVDHKWVRSVVAANPRSDVNRVYPKAGANHGFVFGIPVTEGAHTLCLSAKNVGQGANFALFCQRVSVNYGPYGGITSVTTPPGALHVTGWAIDNDAPTSPVTVTVRIDGNAQPALVANRSRTDIANRYKGTGSNHGFDATYQAGQGKHTVCVTATNIGVGHNTSLGCQTVRLDDSPTLHVDFAKRTGGQIEVKGWAFDRDVPTTPISVSIAVDNTTTQTVANRSTNEIPRQSPSVGTQHGFDAKITAPEGTHRVCVTAVNVGVGHNVTAPCSSVNLSFTPIARVTQLNVTPTGISVGGWAKDPDTNAPIKVQLSLDGTLVQTVTANQPAVNHNGHGFAGALNARSGRHTVCAVGINVLYGTHNSNRSCQSLSIALSPIGQFQSVSRVGYSDSVNVTGWALDPDTTGPVSVAITVDGNSAGTVQANATRTDIGRQYPGFGNNHGISTTVTTDQNEHKICLTVQNVGGGSNKALGCLIVNAAHPVAPSAPQNVKAVGGYGSADVSWSVPASDGGAPPSSYVVTTSPGGKSVTVPGTTTEATIIGLASKAQYSFTVTAVNVAGQSPSTQTPVIATLAGPPPQTTPAPVSTSRYIRNINNGSSSEQAWMYNAGAADARANPSGHRYLMLLDIGGQDQTDGGVVLSATTRFVSYGALVADVNAYVDGYASQQRSTAPATIAIGTNNDMDVSGTSGTQWAVNVINPIASHARTHGGMTIAGANDIEPGFSAGFSATRNWLGAYLSHTSAPFVFNGSADGCSWTAAHRNCNNGWSMWGLYMLAAGYGPSRIINLPQIYNTAMAGQWKYISITGVEDSMPRINFGGALTEYTACAQSGSCGSLGGHSAWSSLWSNLQSDPRLAVGSLPYSTDLRVN